MKKRFTLIAVMASLLFVACASNTGTGTKVSKKDKALPMNPAVVSGTMSNGMSYYVFKNAKPTNRISLRLVVKVGSIVEEPNQLGVAHLIEHMAFNGTEHFEKNSLIDYAESIGMDFGAEVNAYTSFEETVYKLEVPADDPSYLETALLIFKDWASAVTFDQEELDKERGVVTEEWRGRLGVNGRLVDAVLPFELADSEYVGHLPIGSMDVIANITREEVVEFYKKWYQPENMSVIVTGPIESKEVEKLVKSTMKDIPASAKKNVMKKGYVPARTEKDVLVFVDSEMPYTQVQLITKDEEYRPIQSEADLKRVYLSAIVRNVLNMRFAEISSNPQSPWLAANGITFTETNSTAFNGTLFIPKDDSFGAAFQQMLEEIDRLLLFGVTQTEFDREKESLISTEKDWYAKRETISSQERAESLVSYCVTGAAFVSDDDYMAASNRVFKEITLEDVNRRVYEMLEGRGTLCMIFATEEVAKTIPSKEELIGFWENYQSESLAEYEDNVAEGELMARPATKADVINKRTKSKLGITEYTLSNGIKIIVNVAKNEKSRINMSVLSKGGTSLVSDEEWMSCYVSPIYALYSGIGGLDVNQLQKYFSNKNVNLDINIYEHSEYITGYSSPEELECLIQLAYLLMTKPQFTDMGWYYTQMIIDQQAKAYAVQPLDYFYSQVLDFLNAGNIRYTPITPQKAAMINREEAERLYKERFLNPGDFTFIFYGDINEKDLIDLCRYYFGNFNTDNYVAEEAVYEDMPFPPGVTEKTYRKGKENQGQVYMAFEGKLPDTKDVKVIFKDDAMIEQLRALIDIKLREIIREDKSGSYGVGVYSSIGGLNTNRCFQISIDFGCEPAREKELAAEVLAVLKDLTTNPVPQVYIDKINESYKRNYEANMQDASWCISEIEEVEIFKVRPADASESYEAVPGWTTRESMLETAQRFINFENYFCGFLEPEK